MISYETTQKDPSSFRYNTQWLARLCQRGSQFSFPYPSEDVHLILEFIDLL